MMLFESLHNVAEREPSDDKKRPRASQRSRFEGRHAEVGNGAGKAIDGNRSLSEGGSVTMYPGPSVGDRNKVIGLRLDTAGKTTVDFKTIGECEASSKADTTRVVVSALSRGSPPRRQNKIRQKSAWCTRGDLSRDSSASGWNLGFLFQVHRKPDGSPARPRVNDGYIGKGGFGKKQLRRPARSAPIHRQPSRAICSPAPPETCSMAKRPTPVRFK